MKINRKIIPFGVAVLLYLIQIVSAQEIKLSVSEAIELAKQNNFDIKLIESETDKMQAQKNKSLSAFLPQITLSETFVKTNDPLNAFGFKLKQEIVSQMDFNPALLNDPDDITNYNTKLEVKQPLINIDGFFGRAAAADGLSAMEYKEERTRNYVSFMVRIKYFKSVLMEKSLAVVEQALKTAEANNKMIKDYFEEGLITKADLLKGDVFVFDLQSKKADVENQLNTSINDLKYFLGLDQNKKIELTDTLSFEQVNEINYDLNRVIENRSDFKAYKNRVSSMDKMTKMEWAKFLPRLNAFGSYDFNDKDAFGTNAESWMVGLNLKWDLFKGFQNIADIQKAKAELNHAEIEYEKAKREGSIEIKNAVGEFETMKKRLTLASKSVEQSKESLRIIKDRYKKGLEKTADLLIAETEFSNAKLKYLNTLFQYNVTLNKIELLLEKKIDRG